MSTWLDRIKNDIIIIMGNGKTFSPTWINPKKQVDYNIASFNFPNVGGTLVKRGMPLGRKFDLEIFFQGENHLDTASDFEFAAKDSRAWTIRHPYYDTIIVQPTSLLFDNTQHNLTKITGTLLETIQDNNPITTVSAIDDIQLQKENLDATLSGVDKNGNIYATIYDSKDVNKLSTTVKTNFKLSVPIIKIPSEFETYNNLFSQAESVINTATASPLLVMREVIALITEPAKFTTEIQNRLNLLNAQFNSLRTNVTALTTSSSKKVYQNTGAATISSMCYSYVFPFAGQNTNARLVLNQMNLILAAYDLYLSDLDAIQTLNGASTTSFIPDANSLIGLNNIINTTVANLYQIALNSKSERKFILENDTNIINLTHRLYGLDPLDANIDQLFAENGWCLNEILGLKKGTEVVYYI